MFNFSIVLIAKNETKTLPRLAKSLHAFIERGGEVILLDTGSTDGTANLARSFGFKVTEAGDKHSHTIDKETAIRINADFLTGDEERFLQGGDKYFDFSGARNHASSLASNDWVSFVDADEVFSKLNIDRICEIIKDPKLAHLEYQFIFSHDQWGHPAIQFVQSKMFNRKKMKWEGLVHEVVSPINGGGQSMYLTPDVFLLEHFQIPGERHSYLKGLALDCFLHPDKDRNSHYFARELLWNKRPKSAIKEFMRHIAMNRWPAERSQSMIFIGDAYGVIGKPELQVEFYNKAFFTDCTRREPLLKLAHFYKHNKNPMAANCYATAALEIGWVDFYANNKAHYTNEPHEILYWAKGWFGDVEGAKKHLLEALKWCPLHPEYLRDTKYYFEYADQGIDGWMQFPELLWLYNTAKRVLSIAELGCWKGRSTHALASGTAGKVTVVDHFKGSENARDMTHHMAKVENILETFKKNMSGLKNITINQNDGKVAAGQYPDKNFDMVFIDAGHTYEEVKADIETWLPKAKLIICGDDYLPGTWDGVVKAVNETFGKPDGVVGKVWYKFIGPKVTFIIPTLGRPEGLKRCLDSIEKLIYPKELIEVIVLEDQPRKGVPLRVKEGVEKSWGKYIVFGSNDVEFEPDSLIKAVELAEKGYGLVAFNTGIVFQDEGNICEHFIIRRDLISKIGGEIFDTDFHHVGVDNLLWAKCKKLNEATRCEEAVAKHHHFSNGAPMDAVYEEGWRLRDYDRELLKVKLEALST